METQAAAVAPINISNLAASLVALSHAPRDDKGVPEVTPGFFRLSVSTGGFVNRIYRLVYHLIDTYLRKPDDSVMRKHLLETLDKVKAAFAIEASNVNKAFNEYVAYLERLKSGIVTSDKSMVSVRHVLSDWNNAMRPSKGVSLKQMISTANEAFTNLVKGKEESSGFLFNGGESLLTYQNMFEKVTGCQQIIELEENLNTPLPLGILKKLTEPDVQLDTVEADTLKQWIEKVNGCWRVDVRKLHRGLKAASLYLGMTTVSKTGKPSHLAIMEQNLRSRGVQALSKPDGRHLSWRHGIEDSRVVKINGKEYPLEERLIAARRDKGVESHWAFPLKDDANKVVIVGINEAILGLEVADSAACRSPVPYADIFKMDPSGRCAIAERLATPMDEKRWESMGDVLKKADKNAATQVADLLKALAAMEKTPNVTAGEFRFNSSDALKLQHPMKEGTKFDYPHLVNLAYKAANGSLQIFAFLLRESGIGSHSVGAYYQDVLADALKDSPRGPDKVAVERNIADPAVRRQGKVFAKDVSRLLERCAAELRTRYQIPSDMRQSEITVAIGKAIELEYKRSVGAGILWPTLNDKVVTATAATLNLTKVASS